MSRSKFLPVLLVLLPAVFSLSACSGAKTGGVCTVNCSTTGSVAVTMVADTLPANPSLLTFQVTISSITFTPATGTATKVNLSPALTVDLMRLQSDTVFLGTFANIPAANYTSVTLALTSTAKITFLNDTTAAVSGCPVKTICPLTATVVSPSAASVSFAVTSNTVSGVGIDLNYANAVSISAGNLVVDFANNNVLSAFTLPRANSNLASGQLDLIEDFTGIVSLGNPAVTINSALVTGRGALTASATSTTEFDPDPTGTHCPAGTNQVANCVSSNQIASMDVILKSDGTLSIKEIEPLLSTLQDSVEGLVVSINQSSQTQFTMVVTDVIPAAASSLIGAVHIGDGLTVNLNAVKPFLVDTKGLPAGPNFGGNFGGNFSSFVGQTDTTAIHLGQSIAVHVTSFTAASGTTIASANTDTVTLRFTRFTTAASTAASPAFDINTFPSFFNATGIAQVQTFSNTNLDGISSTGNLAISTPPVGMRALFIENPGDSLTPAFYAAKVRQH